MKSSKSTRDASANSERDSGSEPARRPLKRKRGEYSSEFRGEENNSEYGTSDEYSTSEDDTSEDDTSEDDISKEPEQRSRHRSRKSSKLVRKPRLGEDSNRENADTREITSRKPEVIVLDSSEDEAKPNVMAVASSREKAKKSKKSRDASKQEVSGAEDETSSRKNTSGKTAPKTRSAPTAVDCKFLSDAAQWRDFEKGFHAHVNNGESLGGLIKDFPSLTQAEIDAIIPDAIDELDYDDDWTHENEKDLRFDWENDPDRDNLITPPPSNPAFPRTFKIILRFLRVSPLVMFSPKNYLEWDLTQKYGKGKFVTRHWSPEFCKTLGSLSTHPLFTQSYLLLVMALQYASIMSRNDWRTWSLIIPNKDRFWEILDNLVDEARGQNNDIAKIHKQARRLAKEENVSVPFFSAFMLRLETFRDKNRPKILDDGKKAIYPVGLVEVQNVRDAVDSTNVGGVNMFVSTEVFRRYSIGNQGDHEVDGPRKADLPKYMDWSHLAIRRHLAREENRARRMEAEGLADSQNEALGSADSDLVKSLQEQIRILKNAQEEERRRHRESMRSAKSETMRALEKVKEAEVKIEPH